jgi:hypothetical protein
MALFRGVSAEEAERFGAVEALAALTARAELREASRPHTILVWDPGVGSSYACGVDPTAFAAVQDAEKVRTETNQEAEHDAVVVLVIPIYGVSGC